MFKQGINYSQITEYELPEEHRITVDHTTGKGVLSSPTGMRLEEHEGPAFKAKEYDHRKLFKHTMKKNSEEMPDNPFKEDIKALASKRKAELSHANKQHLGKRAEDAFLNGFIKAATGQPGMPQIPPIGGNSGGMQPPQQGQPQPGQQQQMPQIGGQPMQQGSPQQVNFFQLLQQLKGQKPMTPAPAAIPNIHLH